MSKRIHKKGGSHSPDGKGGNYILLPHAVIDSPAFKTASFRAQALLILLHRTFNGFNNGKLCLSRNQIAEGLNCQNHAANRKALGELVARGLVVQEKSYPLGSRLANEYRLTFISTGREGDPRPATNDYLHWAPGDAGTVSKRKPGNFRRAAIAHEDPVSCAAIAHDRKLSCAAITHEDLETDANPSSFHGSSCAAIAQHIGSHTRGQPGAGDRVSTDTLENLRDRVKAALANRTATQKSLADAAGILPGTLSKFLHHGRGLPRAQCMDLQLALGQHLARAA